MELPASCNTSANQVGEYEVLQKLGSGSFSIVYLARHRQHPDAVVAIKAISREKLNPKLQKSLESEISILQKHQHDNIVKLFNIQKVTFCVRPYDIVLQSKRHIYLILEYCAGGDLHKFIKK